MILRRTNGFHPLSQLRGEMDRLVTDFFAQGGPQARFGVASRGFPALNVWEDGETIFAEAEVPGLKADDIDISVVGNELTLRGRRGGESREGVAYHRQERGVGEFNRVIRLPVEVNASKVEASLNHGVLLVHLPKAETAKPKKIQVSTSPK
jgi:HSP20 family protein